MLLCATILIYWYLSVYHFIFVCNYLNHIKCIVWEINKQYQTESPLVLSSTGLLPGTRTRPGTSEQNWSSDKKKPTKPTTRSLQPKEGEFLAKPKSTSQRINTSPRPHQSTALKTNPSLLMKILIINNYLPCWNLNPGPPQQQAVVLTIERWKLDC